MLLIPIGDQPYSIHIVLVFFDQFILKGLLWLHLAASRTKCQRSNHVQDWNELQLSQADVRTRAHNSVSARTTMHNRVHKNVFEHL